VKVTRHFAAAVVNWRWAVFDATIVPTSIFTYMGRLWPRYPFSTALPIIPHGLIPCVVRLIDQGCTRWIYSRSISYWRLQRWCWS
jgi:hypothetical protein